MFQKFQTVSRLWTTGILNSHSSFYLSLAISGGALAVSIAHPSVHQEIYRGLQKVGAFLAKTFPPASSSPSSPQGAQQSWGGFENISKFFKDIPTQFNSLFQEIKKHSQNFPQTFRSIKEFFQRITVKPEVFRQWLSQVGRVFKNLVLHFKDWVKLFLETNQRETLFNLFRAQNWEATRTFLEVLSGASRNNSRFDVDDGALSVF